MALKGTQKKLPETPPCMFRLKRSNGIWSTEDDWKVTAHYVVQLTARDRRACIRISNYSTQVAPYSVLHLSLRELHRLFRPRVKAEYTALMREVRREMIRHER